MFSITRGGCVCFNQQDLIYYIFIFTQIIFLCFINLIVCFPPTGGPGCWAVGWQEEEGKVEQQYQR